MKNKSSENKKTYSASDLSEYLGISLAASYNLMNSQEFPSFRIGKRVLVTHEAFEEWLKDQQQKS